jgi:hypothetical protein
VNYTKIYSARFILAWYILKFYSMENCRSPLPSVFINSPMEQLSKKGSGLTMTKITLIGTNGEEVRVCFDSDDPKRPSTVLVLSASRLPTLMEQRSGLRLGWRMDKQDSSFLSCPSPDVALHWLRDNGFRAIGEEESWLQTGEWA